MKAFSLPYPTEPVPKRILQQIFGVEFLGLGVAHGGRWLAYADRGSPDSAVVPLQPGVHPTFAALTLFMYAEGFKPSPRTGYRVHTSLLI